MHGTNSGSPYWSEDATKLAALFESGPNGLTSVQAATKLRVVGPNNVEDVPHLSALRLLVRQFESPLVLILLVAAIISLGLKQWVDAGIILAIVVGSSILSFFHEYRASTAVNALRARLALTCRVVRDGVDQTVPVSDVVPGDVVVLSAGNMIPADGVVLDANDFLVSEAGMTGESFPVEKRPGIVPPETPVASRSNSVFLGASVRSGTARVLAVRTGRSTEFGVIAARMKARPPETDFARGVRQFGMLLIRVMIVIVLFVLTVNVLLDRPVIESLLFAVALSVGISPELLPAIISVTLSAGARAMSARGVIVRRLDAIENLGSMNILCTDKTGTLTEGTVVLHDVLDAVGQPSARVRSLAFLNASFESGIANPLDAAIVADGEQTKLTTVGFTKIDEIPYDFIRRRLTVMVSADDAPSQHLVITKGAVANVLDVCTMVERNGREVPLDAASRAELEAIVASKGAEGFRVLAVATRDCPAMLHYTRDDEQALTFRGMLIFFDPPKADAARTIQSLNALGIRIKVVSGDNRYVTAYLARAVGLDASSMLTGAQITQLKDEALWYLAPRTDLFVEIDPQQKERIVRALQRTGHAVGFLGDGINDAPALHAADVGISVEQAVDVARESADIILLRPDLDVLRLGVEDGRRTFANTLKYITITTSANFGNMISMAVATPFLPFLPLAAKQILLNNFLSDLPSIAISSDNVDADRLATPQRWSIKDIRRFMIVFGLISSVFDLLTFATLLLVFQAGVGAFQTSWFIISVLTELLVVLVLRTRGSMLQSRPSGLLWRTTVAVALATFAIPFLGELSTVFGFVSLSLQEIGAVVAIVTGYLVATEWVKRWYFRSAFGASLSPTTAT